MYSSFASSSQSRSQIHDNTFLISHEINFPPGLSQTEVALISVAVVLVCLLLAAPVVWFILRKKKRNQAEQDKKDERSDINPVYGTYEVHDDPVAEVRTF